MNNQIDALRKQAMETYTYSDCDGDNNRGIRLNEEKFAELIIRECINEVSLYHSATIHDGFIPENPTREHYEELAYIKGNNAGYNDAVKQIADGLKNTFELNHD